MDDNRTYVLITRPAEDALPLAREVEARGFVPLVEPLLVIRNLPFTMEGDYGGLVFTSANAVRVVAETSGRRDHPVYCVGDHTADVARACGWESVTSAGGDAQVLAALLADAVAEGGQLLHLSGQDVTRDLEVPGLRIERRVVYRAGKVRRLGAACVYILENKRLAAALFFSARTGEAFAEALAEQGLEGCVRTTKALCLADSVVESLRHLPWQDVAVAKRPERRALTALLDKVQG